MQHQAKYLSASISSISTTNRYLLHHYSSSFILQPKIFTQSDSADHESGEQTRIRALVCETTKLTSIRAQLSCQNSPHLRIMHPTDNRQASSCPQRCQTKPKLPKVSNHKRVDMRVYRNGSGSDRPRSQRHAALVCSLLTLFTNNQTVLRLNFTSVGCRLLYSTAHTNDPFTSRKSHQQHENVIIIITHMGITHIYK